MLLSDSSIAALVEGREVRIEPFCAEMLKPASYVLRLGETFRRMSAGEGSIDIWSSDDSDSIFDAPIVAQQFQLMPGEFVMATSMEVVGIGPRVSGFLSLLSHHARTGLSANGGANTVNPLSGWDRPFPLVLELTNQGSRPVLLRASMPIAHLHFMALDKPTSAGRPLSRTIFETRSPVSAPCLWDEYAFLRNHGA